MMSEEVEVLSNPYTDVADGLGWGRVYWTNGAPPDRSPRFRTEVKDPPCNGWMGVFIMDKGGKTVTLFCPFTFTAYNVSKHSAEFNSLKAQPFDLKWHKVNFPRKWAEMVQFGWQRDFDSAAAIMRRFKMEVPLTTTLTKDGEEEKTRGGKTVEVKLTKPVKKNGRRGQVLVFFLDGGGRRSILEAMAEIDVTRKNLLSQMFLLQKEHGIGYTITGDSIEVHLPEGCTNPYDDVEVAPVVQGEPEFDPLALDDE